MHKSIFASKQEPTGSVEPSADGSDVPQGVPSGLIEGTILRVPLKQQASGSNAAVNASKASTVSGLY